MNNEYRLSIKNALQLDEKKKKKKMALFMRNRGKLSMPQQNTYTE